MTTCAECKSVNKAMTDDKRWPWQCAAGQERQCRRGHATGQYGQ